MNDIEYVKELALIERQCLHHSERVSKGEFTFISQPKYTQMLNLLAIAAIAEKVMCLNGFEYDFKKLRITQLTPKSRS